MSTTKQARPLPPKDNRFFRTDQVSWKWKMSAPTLLGVATSASANVVQITHPDQITTTNSGVERSTITGDFTADGVIDTNAVGLYNTTDDYVRFSVNSMKVASAGSMTGLFATVNGVSAPPTSNWFILQKGLVPITFNDARINGGALTAAFIDVQSVGTSFGGKIQILRTVFDDESTAAPAGVVAGGANPEFVPGRAAAEAALRTSLGNKIKKLKKKAKKVKKKGNSTKAKKLKKKLKKLQKQVAKL